MRRSLAALAALGLAGCAAAPAPGPAPDPAASSAPPPPAAALPAAAGCVELSRSVLAGGPAPAGWLAVRSVLAGAVDHDLAVGPADAAVPARCELVVDRPVGLPVEPPRLIARERVEAAYLAGTVERPNPEHARLERELKAAERQRRDSGIDILATGEPMTDLIGAAIGLVIAGAEHAVGLAEAAELRRQLEATLPTVAEPKQRPYAYEALTVEAARAARIRLALIDRVAGEAREAVSEVRETRRLRVEPGRRGDDAAGPPPARTFATMAAAEAWQSAPPPLPLSQLLAHLLEVGRPAAASADAILAGWAGLATVAPAAGPTPAADRAAAGDPAPAAAAADADPLRPALLTVRGAAGSATGVRIGPRRLLVAAAALGTSDLAEIVDPAGRSSLALVRRRDAGGIALLDTSLDGPFVAIGPARPGPARLIAGDRPPAGQAGRLIADEAGEFLWLADAGPAASDGIVLLDGRPVGLVTGSDGTVATADNLAGLLDPAR